MIKLYEAVPTDPVIRASDYYMNNWLYIYRYEGIDKEQVINRMLDKAKYMAENGYYYRYVNPSFGSVDWCCVTVVSYWVCIGCNLRWKMGSSDQSYLWSPRYGGEYDRFLLDAGFTKYSYNEVAIERGDIIQSWGHVALADVEGGFDVSTMPELRKGSRGNVVKNLQVLLNYWTTQNGTYKPIIVDGYFGDETEERLKLYQRLQRLYVDGICGIKTWTDILLA